MAAEKVTPRDAAKLIMDAIEEAGKPVPVTVTSHLGTSEIHAEGARVGGEVGKPILVVRGHIDGPLGREIRAKVTAWPPLFADGLVFTARKHRVELL